MNLNNLKPAWKQFQLLNSMEPMDQKEILFIIERADRQTIITLPRHMTNVILFIILLVCCKGG